MSNPYKSPEEKEVEALQNEMLVVRNRVIKSLPFLWMLPNGMFMSANFYTLWERRIRCTVLLKVRH